LALGVSFLLNLKGLVVTEMSDAALRRERFGPDVIVRDPSAMLTQ